MERILCFLVVFISIPIIAFASTSIILYWGLKEVYPWRGLDPIIKGFKYGLSQEKETYDYYTRFFSTWNSDAWK